VRIRAESRGGSSLILCLTHPALPADRTRRAPDGRPASHNHGTASPSSITRRMQRVAARRAFHLPLRRRREECVRNRRCPPKRSASLSGQDLATRGPFFTVRIDARNQPRWNGAHDLHQIVLLQSLSIFPSHQVSQSIWHGHCILHLAASNDAVVSRVRVLEGTPQPLRSPPGLGWAVQHPLYSLRQRRTCRRGLFLSAPIGSKDDQRIDGHRA
jgi:hypothetical protein